MLTRRELETLAEQISTGNVGHAERLYIQDVMLVTISRDTVDELVFKGGTALLKCYQLDRFSEDLDFTERVPIEFDDLLGAIERDLGRYGLPVVDREVERSESAVRLRVAVEGPLYDGDRRSRCYIRLHVNTRSSVKDFAVRRYTPPFRDLPTVDLVVLREPEILAEKIRAICTRSQPRDLYDIYHMLHRSTPLKLDLVQDKLDYYDLEFDHETVLDRAARLEPQWPEFEPLVYGNLPSFGEAIGMLRDAMERHD